MGKKKFNQDQFGLTLKSLRDDLETNNKLKRQELEQNKQLAEKEIATKDRVNISLKEYNELKSRLEVLESNNNFLEGLVKDLRIENYLDIMDYKTIEVQVIKDDIKRKQRVYISFDIEPLN